MMSNEAVAENETAAEQVVPPLLDQKVEEVLDLLKTSDALADLKKLVATAIEEAQAAKVEKVTVLRVIPSGPPSEGWQGTYDPAHDQVQQGQIEIDPSVPVQVLPPREVVLPHTTRPATLAPQLVVGQRVERTSATVQALFGVQSVVDRLTFDWQQLHDLRQEVWELTQALTQAQKETVAKVKEAATLTRELDAARAREQQLVKEKAGLLENMKQLERRERLMRLDLGERRVHEILNGDGA